MRSMKRIAKRIVVLSGKDDNESKDYATDYLSIYTRNTINPITIGGRRQ